LQAVLLHFDPHHRSSEPASPGSDCITLEGNS
jgi:hypothetical protein